MKKKIFKSLAGAIMIALMTLTFTMNAGSSAEGDITLENIAALNDANAEEGNSFICALVSPKHCIIGIIYNEWGHPIGYKYKIGLRVNS